MGQRVGLNQSQFHKLKQRLADNVPFDHIVTEFNVEPQSLENIIAHLEDREPRTLAIEDNPEMNRLMAENAALRARLGIEDDEDGELRDPEEADGGGDDELGGDED